MHCLRQINPTGRACCQPSKKTWESKMGIELPAIKGSGLAGDSVIGADIASTVIYSLPNCGIDPTMADDLDLEIDDIFSREITVPRQVAACVDAALDDPGNGGAVANRLNISTVLARKIQTANVDRGLRRQAYYAAYRLPILPSRHKAILVSREDAFSSAAELAVEILRARGAQQIVLVTPPDTRRS
jgi:predicted phosphoribosyltransferase